MHRPYLPVLTLLALALSGLACAQSPRPTLQQLGREVKMRVLVDKVMQPVAGWKTEEWMVKEAAAAGFNVFSPRRGYDDPVEVAKVTDWCRKYGLYHLPWMRGVQDVPADRTLSDGKRIVWANGNEQPIWSPNSDELWAWMASYLVPFASQGAADHTLLGVFLDYENYWQGGSGNLYELSYDDVIMGKFAAAKGLTLPALQPGQRKAWLQEQKLHEEFERFQVAYWRQKCRELRAAIDKVNPEFRFCIYPAPGTKFMLEATYPEWATAQAPLILADPWTYGRPGRYTTHKKALEGNQQIIERGLAVAKDKGINYQYIGGIDPVVGGADPEFCGKNALLLSGLTDGYWIFYEGPVYAKDHPDYFKWFAWANQRMEQKDFAAAWQARETDDPNGFPRIRISGKTLARTEPRQYPDVKLRGANALVVSASKTTPLDLQVETFRIGRNETALTWTLKDLQWQDLQQGEIPVAKVGNIKCAVPQDGLYVLLLEAGGNAYSVKSSNAPLGIFAEPVVHFIYGVERLYFAVPAGVAQLKFNLRGGGGVETVKLAVQDSDGKEVVAGEVTEQHPEVEVPVSVGAQGGKVWSLSLGRAASGTLEDVMLVSDKQLPPVLSYFADEVFDVQRGK